jgi:long-chain acyl-CoA synthetase
MTFLDVNWSNLDRPALFTEDGVVVNYCQLYADVISLAKLIPSRQLIFFVGQNDRNTITTYLSCLEIGAVPLLLNKSFSLESFSGLRKVYEPAYFFLPNGYLEEMGSLELITSIGDYGLWHDSSVSPPLLSPMLALLMATSGSTGSPKLVRLSMENVLSNAKSIATYLSVNSDDRAITSLPFNYSYGLSVINSHLFAGAAISLSGRTFFDSKFWTQMSDHKVTSLAGVPYSYEMLLKLRFERMSLPALHTLTQAGGAMNPQQAFKIFQLCAAKGMKFFTMYGQTEATARIAYLSPDDFDRKVGSIGKAIPDGRLWLEGDYGEIINSPNKIGELIYSGPNVALGYAENKKDLFEDNAWRNVLRTGDLAKFDDEGFFYIAGRRQRFIKMFGVRVSLDQVEAWFAKQGLSSAALGEDDFLRIFIESDSECKLQSHASRLSCEYGIHESALRVCAIKKIPRLDTGKIDYQCLQKI